MRRVLTSGVVIGAMLLTACGGGDQDVARDDEGNVADSGDLGVFKMRVGDCFNFPGEDTSDEGIESLPALPCDEPHDAEVYAVYDHDAPSFPGDVAMQSAAEEGCLDRFADFVGGPYETSDLFYSSLYPSEGSWEQRDDREVICYVFLPEEQLTGTARGYDAGKAVPDGGDGTAAAAGDDGTVVSVFELLVGDCFDDDSVDGSGPEETVTIIDCAGPHDNEVYLLFDLPDGPYPGDDQVNDVAADECLDEFDRYVGIAYEESILDVIWLVPDEPLWEAGDREVVCVLYHIDLEKLEGSMRGAAV